MGARNLEHVAGEIIQARGDYVVHPCNCVTISAVRRVETMSATTSTLMYTDAEVHSVITTGLVQCPSTGESETCVGRSYLAP